MSTVQLETIINDNYDAIFKYCRRRVNKEEDAYDLTQTVFTALVESFDRINHESCRQWLYNTANNKVIDFYRKNKRRSQHMSDDEYDDERIGAIVDPFEALNEHNFENNIEAILGRLSELERELCEDILKYSQGLLTYAQIAEKNSCSETVIRKRVSRLKSKVAKIIGEFLYMLVMRISR